MDGEGGGGSPSPSDPPAPGSLRELGPSFRRYVVLLGLFTLGNASDAFLLLRAQELGVAVPLIPLFWGALHVSKMIWSLPGGMAADRVAPWKLIVGGWGLYALVYGGFALANQAWQAWALAGLYGLYFGLTEAPEKALVADLAPSHLRARAFGIYHFAQGLGALPASLIFGALWQWQGAAAAFGFGGGLALLAALLLPWALSGSPAVKGAEVNSSPYNPAGRT